MICTQMNTYRQIFQQFCRELSSKCYCVQHRKRTLSFRFLAKLASTFPKMYSEHRDFVEKERPDWLQALMPRRINGPSDYWPLEVLALATVQAALTNQLIKDAEMKLDPTFGVIEGQTGHLLQFDVPTFYVSKKLLTVAARTDLSTDIFMDALPL